ncbi:Cellulose synthase catalytic subunit A [UDP-forming] [Gracilariopsis chorda]|uniref:Cellulose synthase catalytic subunit A [UDP-forming] n=1 Tax=Gracilariopsis chorda TaxID=448386 RepID=A0A2V3J314_9FLOR|nr:Cellulose synthase catalytic subunit A [UDP-forming] [Gracilariopsis chorda]|eukprot:PXF48502.1 Cellulose synthase catalytic subunit A [UDP-forming] [Gracilariopsis chorda]
MADSDSDFSSIAESQSRNNRQPPRSEGQGSVRSRASRFSRTTKAPSTGARFSRTDSLVRDQERGTKTLFQWNGGGKNVFIAGSWDEFKEKLPMESLKPGSYRIVLPIPATERVEYFFYVDGQKRVAADLPSHVNEHGEHVNIKHSEPTVAQKAGRVSKILSKISGLDLYSPFQRQQIASMIIFRLFYILTIPAAGYYFYWLMFRGGNESYPVIWITFTVAEWMSLASAVIGLFSMWSPVRRKWRSLDALKPPLPSEDWPSVDVVIAHYKEDPEQMREALRCALNLDYPAHLLHVIIADDGYFAAPKVVERTDLGVKMYQMLAEEAGYDPLIDEIMHENGLVEHYVIKSGEEHLPRMDCALECHHFDFGPFTDEERRAPGVLPRISHIARVKPDNHHNKAGNINNVLFNADTDGKLILFLDADMQVTENFLLRTVPLMLEELSHDAADHVLPEDLVDPEVGLSNGNNAWRINRDVAFVQAPQRFHNVDAEDYMAHRNAVFYDGICAGRDGFGLTPFVGTNACWRREVLREINGFVYGSVTEDTLTSNEVHNRGYVSKYASEDLAWGEAPVSVAAAMLQRQRWAKGAVMNGMKIIKEMWNGDRDKRFSRRRGEIDEYYEYRRTARRPNNAFVRAMFALDSTLYPFLGVSAYLYIITSVAYLATAQAPIAPQNIGELAAAFILYYTIRYIAFYSAFAGVSSTDILRSQQTWFSYNVCHVMGVVDALNVNGRMGWVANTGERNRRYWMEWVNILLCFLLSFMIVFRLVAFLAQGGCAPWDTLGSVSFGSYILMNMYPMASISLNERLSSASDEEKEHKPLSFPVPHLISIGTIIGVGYLATWAKTPCGLRSTA